ncbi:MULTISPECIES: Mce family protein [unclassified Rhodococcus (in: high G+C Gram-positive bacteria)]|uniref:Mce family protein n=1 Tax=unclassified Rhodococcus (in: high G+C Gram-positive bacteria) TaxID=192944 RepID=UPI00163AD51F|nr:MULTISPECIES: Mce family protein [unclassified Rhodococcus (in: high G+C Gram-positive bacteria)]MBC2639492.1 Mce family protein [Rhodococcus sp. 3A]MBC2895763.1 Mce family protein [Rhodococcus sp. 4CII]
MSRARSQDFLRGAPGRQARVLNTAGLGVVVTTCAVIAAAVWVYPGSAEPDGMPISIDIPYVGPGVDSGTKVILRGGEVGVVTGLERMGADSVRMDLRLDPSQIAGLTDAFDVDFRPQNYFGSTAVNLVGKPGGSELEAHRTLDRTPTGDFTMSTMIEKGSLTVDGTLTDSMIAGLDEVVRYTDGLTPMIDAGLLFADRVAQTQQALPSELLGRVNDILAVFPAFNRQAIDSLTHIYNSTYNQRPDGSVGVDDPFMDETDAGLTLAAGQLFGQAGQLLKSHGEELTPVTEVVGELAGVVPHLYDGGARPERLRDAVERLDTTFEDSGDGQRLNLRIVLDDLPALAAPLAYTDAAAPAGNGAGR